jgi:transposase, IS30 family
MWDMNNYRHISQSEREVIYLSLHQGKSYRDIGKILKRDHRAIEKEIKRNGIPGKDPRQTYSPSNAQKISEERRKESKRGKLDDPVLQNYVIRKLGSLWSPEQISGRLKKKVPNLSLTAQAIYDFIYAKENKKLRLWEFLRRKHPKRQLFNEGRVKTKAIPGRIFIEERPIEITERKKAGHWETDLMEGVKSERECLSVFTDRKTGLLIGEKLPDKKAETKKDSTLKLFERKPKYLIQSITQDNGVENYEHQRVGAELKCPTYFCHPYHPYEKGTVENTIGLIRQYIPKKTPLSTVTKSDINKIFWDINNRPRKRLDFLTPSEAFYLETGWGT